MLFAFPLHAVAGGGRQPLGAPFPAKRQYGIRLHAFSSPAFVLHVPPPVSVQPVPPNWQYVF